MKTIALRFADNIAPSDGTIVEHEKIIDKLGYVWYGKFGTRVSDKNMSVILASEDKRILLIHSGTSKRYWLHIEDISYETPELTAIPEYYRGIAGTIKTWFKVIKIEKAEKGVMAKCVVASSGSPLSAVSRHSMSPYFIIDYDEGA
jgi:hypothetical protein